MTDNAIHVSPTATTKAPTATKVLPKEAGFGIRHGRGYIIAIIIGLLMAILAPLQTDFIPFWPRLLYWQILMVSGATIALGVTEIVERRGRLSRWPWIEVPVIGVLIALPLTMIVMGAGAMFFGATAGGALRFSYNFGITALISVAITTLGHVLHIKDTPAAAVSEPAMPLAPTSPVAQGDRFAERLPLPMRFIPVIALEAEDHYLRVHFEGGQSMLILMRLSDAIAELPADTGAQTHRSWWVARDAVRGVTKADGRATLTLDNGTEAQVSRSFYRALGDKGWLA